CLGKCRIRPRLPMKRCGLRLGRRITPQQKPQYADNHGAAESHTFYTSACPPADSAVRQNRAMPIDMLCRSINMPSPGGNHTVLIVDDEKIIGETFGPI